MFVDALKSFCGFNALSLLEPGDHIMNFFMPFRKHEQYDLMLLISSAD